MESGVNILSVNKRFQIWDYAMRSPESEDQGFTLNVGMKSVETQRKQGTVPSAKRKYR